MNGNLIIFKINGTAIAACKSGEIQSGCESIEIASATQQKFKEFIAGRTEWTVNASYLVTTAARISDLLTVGTTVTFDVVDRSGTVNLQGSVIVVNCKQTFTKGSISNGSFQFKGTGALVSVES